MTSRPSTYPLILVYLSGMSLTYSRPASLFGNGHAIPVIGASDQLIDSTHSIYSAWRVASKLRAHITGTWTSSSHAHYVGK
ncbi:hypothetical protein BDN71DRAFT_1442584 [Pleurotus eryngii]|uniref:Uncharacterized protein n=1 Tax=Pleurotus eryngii TaxID=5323 RepID=A0A9P6DIK3_PLEER|nr:hypothetical protein BDN71DRAFT_1442584 [Pleurotus eryngii]